MVFIQRLPSGALLRVCGLALWGVLALTSWGTTASGQTLPRLVNCGDLNGFAMDEPGYELLSTSSAPSNISLSPVPPGHGARGRKLPQLLRRAATQPG
ncbi:MAG: hypothetical protein ACI9EF_003559 [Pseudohongiellaceae bacterium]|jgi:hypothetical protein